MIGRTNTSGGGGLNFRVIGGTSAPSNPNENTIWVNTATTITGWTFSASEPEKPATGMVWISTVTSSPAEFNALKKNSIMVCPVSAKQYAGGAWAEKNAKIYKNGAWVDWAKWLYNNGVWGNGTALTKASSGGSPTVTYNTESIKVICGSDNTYQYLYFPQMENLDGRSKVVLKFKSNATYTASNQTVDYSAGVRLAVSTSTSHNNLAALAKQYNLSSGASYTLELDISNFTGYHYIHLLISRGDSQTSGSVNIDIMEVYLA